MARAASTGAKMALLPSLKQIYQTRVTRNRSQRRQKFVLNICSRSPLFGYGRTGNSAVIWMVAWRIVFRHAHPKRSFSVSDQSPLGGVSSALT